MNVLTSRSVLVPAPGVSVELLDDGAVVWDPAGRQLHRLDVPGRELWARLEPDRSLGAVFDLVAADFQVPAEVVRRDGLPFLADLAARGLLAPQEP